MPTQAPPDDRLADLNKAGEAVKDRVADADHALRICKKVVYDDRERAARRLKVQGSFNGNAQKDPKQMAAAGRAGESNLNFKRHRGLIMNAHAPFFDMVCEVPVCIDGDLEIGDSAQDAELMRGFAQYFHNMVFRWRGFDDMNQLCDLQMLLHGHGILAWEDRWDWRPRPILAGNFYVPNRTNSSLDNCDYAVVYTPMTAGALWRKIDGPTEPGWKIEAAKKAIMDSAINGSEMRDWKWDRWEQAFKNGDINVTETQTKEIALYTLFVEEMDGTISQKLVPVKDSGKNAFVYDSVSKYDSWEQCLCDFAYDIGADGTFYSVKGLGTDIYPFCALLNDIDNSIADLVKTSIKPMWQPTTNAKMEEFKMAKWGGGNFVPNGINPLQVDISRGIVPAIEVSRNFTQTLGNNTSAANPQDLAAPTVEETAKSAMIRAAERAKGTKAMGNRYMRGKDRQYAEMWRRAINPKLRKHHPGAKDALKFQSRCKRLCKKLGVEWELTFTKEDADYSPTGEAGKFTVLECVTNIRANRSLGLGSPAMRFEIAGAMLQLAKDGLLDEIGINNAVRAYVSALTSHSDVDSFMPSLTNGREATQDEAVAAQENNAFSMMGLEAEAEVVPGQNHVIHLSSHIPSMQRDQQACEEGQLDPRECQKRLEAKGRHSQLHLQAIENNPTRKQDFAEASAALNDLAAYQDHLDQTIAEQDKAAAEQPQPGAPDPELVKVQGNLAIKQEKEQGAMALKAQKQEFDQMLKAQQAQFDRQLKDALAAAEVNRKTVTHRVDTAIKVDSNRTTEDEPKK